MSFIERIQKAYPGSQHVSQPISHQHNLSFEGTWLSWPEKYLTDADYQNLRRLSDHAYGPVSATLQNPWYQFLFQQRPCPSGAETAHVRFIQLRVRQLAPEDHVDFQHNLSEIFPDLYTSFFLSESLLIVAEPLTTTSWNSDEMKQVLNTLEGDFYTTITSFIGHFWPVTQQLPLIFKEEQAMFNYSHVTVTDLNEQATLYFARPQLLSSPLAQALKNSIIQDADNVDLITALFNHSGNISLAAKKLYLHRNTLQYRMDRFLNQTGFNLRRPQDRVLCYLLVTLNQDEPS